MPVQQCLGLCVPCMCKALSDDMHIRFNTRNNESPFGHKMEKSFPEPKIDVFKFLILLNQK